MIWEPGVAEHTRREAFGASRPRSGKVRGTLCGFGRMSESNGLGVTRRSVMNGRGEREFDVE